MNTRSLTAVRSAPNSFTNSTSGSNATARVPMSVNANEPDWSKRRPHTSG